MNHSFALQFQNTRNSTIKRVEQLDTSQLGFSISLSTMSIGDTIVHLLKSDRELINACRGEKVSKNLGRVGLYKNDVLHAELLNQLKQSGEDVFRHLLTCHLNDTIQVDRLSGMRQMDLLEVLLIFFDHEAHHRGQIQAMLHLIAAT